VFHLADAVLKVCYIRALWWPRSGRTISLKAASSCYSAYSTRCRIRICHLHKHPLPAVARLWRSNITDLHLIDCSFPEGGGAMIARNSFKTNTSLTYFGVCNSIIRSWTITWPVAAITQIQHWRSLLEWTLIVMLMTMNSKTLSVPNENYGLENSEFRYNSAGDIPLHPWFESSRASYLSSRTVFQSRRLLLCWLAWMITLCSCILLENPRLCATEAPSKYRSSSLVLWIAGSTRSGNHGGEAWARSYHPGKESATWMTLGNVGRKPRHSPNGRTLMYLFFSKLSLSFANPLRLKWLEFSVVRHRNIAGCWPDSCTR
jgi:hypothetical protein